MAVVVERVAVVVGEVPPVHVVHEPVAVVVHAGLAAGVWGVAPDVGLQVRVIVIDPRVDDGDQGATAGRDVPRGRHGDLVHPPEGAVGVLRVVRRGGGVEEVVRLGVLDERVGRGRLQGGRDTLARGEAGFPEAVDQAELVVEVDPGGDGDQDLRGGGL